MTIIDTHRSRVRVAESGCWEWTGSEWGSSGYGCVYREGKKLGAHRVSWELSNGPIPDGAMVLHRCDNRRCCNPDHLFLGDHSDNLDDASAKGRLARKLTPEAVSQIRGRHGIAGASYTTLAREYRVSKGMIRDIIKGKRWRHHGNG